MWLWDGVGGMGRTHDELLGMGKVAGRRGCCSLGGAGPLQLSRRMSTLMDTLERAPAASVVRANLV